ncbi:MAG: BrnT family toxin [Deltaproteobacteria bacterium]|nr:BrnT family toxin [Deltaproteobacteria bacterium]
MYTWDAAKNRANQAKHGISFEEARDHIFEGPNLLAAGIAYNKDGPRHAVIGKCRGKYYVGIFTVTRQGIRIISVRRARHEEERQAKAKGL